MSEESRGFSEIMRIGINLIPLRPEQMGGLEFYVRSLLKHLLAKDKINQYFLFTAYWSHDSVHFEQGRYEKILVVQEPGKEDGVLRRFAKGVARWTGILSIPFVRRLAFSTFSDLHDWVRRLKLDLWFCPMINLDPRQLPIPTVITIPDIQQEYYPEFFTSAELRERALMYRPSCQEATAVITISNFSKRCMVEKYGLPPEKVHCIYLAGEETSLDFTKCPSLDMIRQRYPLPETYAFYPANLWPHKNHPMLILALHRLRKTYGVSLPLVLTGADMGQRNTLEELIRHFQLQDQVHFLGYVGGEELPRLYEGAAMLVFPSLFEGFGIPLVEAMALGCPIAASNGASIPEVVGDAALLFDPRNPDSIAEAMFCVLSNENLRQTLIARGREQAALFSWKKAADETLQVFERACSQHEGIRPVARLRRSRIEGIYPDGWATKTVRLYLPYLEEVEAVKLEGISHHLSYPLTIRIEIDGRRVNDLLVEAPGRFTIVEKLPRPWKAAAGMEITFSADQDFIPKRVDGSPDTRRLAYGIEKLSLICIGGEEVTLYTHSWTQ